MVPKQQPVNHDLSTNLIHDYSTILLFNIAMENHHF